MKRILLFGCVLFFSCAANQQEIFLRANKCYHDGDYQQALMLYDSIPKKGRAVWYNMGNCYYQQELYARAVACWERSRSGAPWHELQDIDAQVHRALNILQMPPHDALLIRLHRVIVSATNAYSLRFMQLLFLCVWYLFFVFGIFFSGTFIRTFRFVCGGSLCALLGISVSVRLLDHQAIRAIVVEQTPLFVGPHEKYQQIDAHMQSPYVAVCQRKDDWCKIRTNSVTGWVPARSIEVA